MADSDDSDDDDLLNCTAAFTSKAPTREELMKKEADNAFLDTLLTRGEEHCSKRARLGEMGAYKDTNDESLTKQVLSMSKSNSEEHRRTLNGLTGLYTDNVVPDDVLKDRIAAIRSCKRERYGERLVIQFDPKRATSANLRFFDSTAETIAALQEIVDKHLEQEKKTGAQDGAKTPLQQLQLVLAQKRQVVLTGYLTTGRLAELIIANGRTMTGIEDFCSWLFCSAVTSRLDNSLAVASQQALMKFLNLGLVPETCWFKSWTSLLDCLKAWIDIGSSPMTGDGKENAKAMANAGRTTTPNNSLGLERLLSIWGDTLAHDRSLSLDQETATNTLVTLLHLSLDSVVLDKIVSIQNILAVVTGRMKEESPSIFPDWAKSTAKAIFHDVSSYNQVPEVKYDDAKGYLTYSLILELVPVTTGLLKMELLNQAFEYCINVQVWRNYVILTLPVFRKTEKRDKISERASEDHWFCLLSSLIALDFLNDDAVTGPDTKHTDTSMEKDLVRIQAIFLLVMRAFDAAMWMWPQSSGSDKCVEEYGRKTEAALITEVLRHMQTVAGQVKGRTKHDAQVASGRNTNYLCTSFENYLSHVAEWAAEQGGMTPRNIVQRTMKHFKVSL